MKIKTLIHFGSFIFGIIPFVHADSRVVYDTSITIPYANGKMSPMESWSWYRSENGNQTFWSDNAGSMVMPGAIGPSTSLSPYYTYQVLDYQIDKIDQHFQLQWLSCVDATPRTQNMILFWTDLTNTDYSLIASDIQNNVIGNLTGTYSFPGFYTTLDFSFEGVANGDLTGKHLGIAMQGGLGFVDFVLKTGDFAPTPEPSSYALLMGLAGLGMLTVKRRRK